MFENTLSVQYKVYEYAKLQNLREAPCLLPMLRVTLNLISSHPAAHPCHPT